MLACSTYSYIFSSTLHSLLHTTCLSSLLNFLIHIMLFLSCNAHYLFMVAVGPWLYRRNTTSRYLIVQERVKFDVARETCESYNSTLAVVTTTPEIEFLLTLLPR